MIPNFRAFNKETKKMYGVDGFELSVRKIYRCSLAYDEFRPGHMETFHFVEDNLDNYILMQSTGIKDKNGIEVFDGDIVKCCRLFNDSLSEYVGQVKFVDFGWNIVDKADTHDPFYNYKDGCPDEIREIENIGNIHENPELLERLEG